MKFMKLFERRDCAIILVLSFVVLLVCSSIIPRRAGLYLLGDEFALFAIAAHFVGYDWSRLMQQGMGYYSFGYPLMLIPGFLISDSGFGVYLYSLILNAVISSLLIPVCFFLSKKFGVSDFTKKPKAWVAILIVVLNGSVIAYSNLGLGENLLLLLSLLSVLCFCRICEKPFSLFRYVTFAVVLMCLFATHMRTMGVLIASVLVLSLMVYQKKIDYRCFLVFLAALVSLLFVFQLVTNHIQTYVWLGNVHANDMGSRMEQFSQLITNVDYISSAFMSAIGQLFYLYIASYGLIFFAMASLIKRSYIVCNKRIINETTNLGFISLFILISALGTFAISVIAMHNPVRGDHFIYGRYNSNILPILVLYMLITAIINEKQLRIWKIALSFIASFAIMMFVQSVFQSNYADRLFMDFNVIYLSWFRDLMDDIGGAFVVATFFSSALCSLIIFLFSSSSLRNKKVHWMALFSTMILCFGLSYISAHTFFVRNVSNADAHAIELRNIINRNGIGNRELPIYFLTMNLYQLQRVLQLEMMDKSFNTINVLDEIQSNEVFLFVSNNSVMFTAYQKEHLDMTQGRSGYILYLLDKRSVSEKKELTREMDMSIFLSSFDGLLENSLGFSDGTRGYIIFGPYVTMPAGLYEIDVELDIEWQGEVHKETLGHLDIHSRYSGQLFQRDFTNEDVMYNQIFTMPLALTVDLEAVEFRVFAEEGTRMAVRSVVVRKVDYILRELELEAFILNNASQELEGIVTTGYEGFAMYGPYFKVNPGEHEFRLDINLTEHVSDFIGAIDIVSDFGQTIHAVHNLYISDFAGSFGTITIPFTNSEKIFNLEVRLHVEEGTVLSIKNICMLTSGLHQ